jgi:hypothetical protein
MTTLHFCSGLNPVHGEVYWIQHYVIKFVNGQTGQWFSLATPVSSTNKTDRHNITKILLKVALNTITLTQILFIETYLQIHNNQGLQHRISQVMLKHGNKYRN